MTYVKNSTVNLPANSNDNLAKNDPETKARVEKLRKQIFPLTKPHTDKAGNVIQVWSTPGLKPIATIECPNGTICYVTKIQTMLNPDENEQTLHNRLLLAQDCEWDYSIKEDGTLVIWPQLIAGGLESEISHVRP